MDYMVTLDIRETGFVDRFLNSLSCEPSEHVEKTRIRARTIDEANLRAEERAKYVNRVDYDNRAIVTVKKVSPV